MIVDEKNSPFAHHGLTVKAAVTPLTSRPMDFVYFIFFCSHIPASLLIDLQALYPVSITPTFIRQLPELYIQMSRDPLIGGVLGYFGNNDHLVWFKSFLLLEMVFQLPVFILGIRGLWKGSQSIYILLLVYAASTTTTTLPCVALLFNTPTTSAQTISAGIVSITSSQRLLLLSSYIPFFLLPLIMTVDMSMRVLRLVRAGITAEADAKRQ